MPPRGFLCIQFSEEKYMQVHFLYLLLFNLYFLFLFYFTDPNLFKAVFVKIKSRDIDRW